MPIDAKKSARANLQEAFLRLRELKNKKAGLLAALKHTKSELGEEGERAPQTGQRAASGRRAAKKNEEKKDSGWAEPYHSFRTSGGRMAAAGRNAKQNDGLVARHLNAGDLFFHADIQGAPTTILKGGQGASEQEKKEVAQWAASFSSAWKIGASAVDVYAVSPGQVSKHAAGGYVGQGAFAIEGAREWFRQTPLALKIGVEGDELKVRPECHPGKMQKETVLAPGPVPKEEAARALSASLSQKADDIAARLPSGKYALKTQG